MDDKGAIANLTALQYKLTDNWVSTLLYRYYDLKYRQLHGSTLGENSEMHFWFGQPQYGIRETNSQGLEGMVRLLYSHRKVNGTLGYRIKQKADYIRHSFDGMLNIQPFESFTSKTQLRARIHNKKENGTATNSYGYAVSQSFAWNCKIWESCPFSLVGQACYFHTDDYNSRIYLTEKAILYGFGLPMLYGEGLRDRNHKNRPTYKRGPEMGNDKLCESCHHQQRPAGNRRQQPAGPLAATEAENLVLLEHLEHLEYLYYLDVLFVIY